MNNLECGWSYTYTASAGYFEATFDPVSILKLNGSQSVSVNFEMGEDCEDNNCTINLIGDGGFGGQVNAKVNLSGGASKSVTLSSSNSYKATWSGMACGEKYTVSATAELSSSANKEAWADAVLSATAEPDSFTLNEEQDVYIKITDSAVQDCGIEVQGTGDTGNGVFANISLSGGASKTATLDESNNYLATWTGLTCGKSYTVSVTKAGEKKNGAVTTTKVTATVNPSGAFTITGQDNDVTKYVKVDLKKEAKQCSITVIGSKPDSTLLGTPNNSIQVSVGGLDNKSATLDSSNDYTYTFSGLTCGIVYTVHAEKPAYNTTKINTASYNVSSGFRSGTLNGDETSILTLEVIKNAYLYIGPEVSHGDGSNWHWTIKAFTSNGNNTVWPFGDDVSSLTVSFFCPTPTEVDPWGNPIQTEFTATFTKSNFHWTSRPFFSSNPPTYCNLTDTPHVDNYVIHLLR